MNLSIQGHHIDVTPALREYVKTKLDRIRRHFDQVIDVSAVLGVEKLQQKAEVTLHVKGKDLFAEAVDTDLYAAIDIVADRLDRQVLKYKNKRQDHQHEAIKHQDID
ncbi:MAG: ribosome-associated translation inhibitor RaiA [Burkholderiales bacterium]|jgi:putative sigma-54 modulation protein|nr:ribosome-associated translation inhibitor RaiA [Burkholderiales bacterium]